MGASYHRLITTYSGGRSIEASGAGARGVAPILYEELIEVTQISFAVVEAVSP
jgi:hypothetical protein